MYTRFRLALVALCAGALSACASAPVQITRGGPEGLPVQARPCFTAPGTDACALPLERAFAEGDRALAGQLLLLTAPSAQGASRDVARAALWLNRQPTLPEQVTGMPILSDLEVPAPEVPPGAILVFPGTSVPPGAATGAPVMPLDLQLPSDGARLASRLGAATGADAALVQSPGGVLAVPAAPQLSRIVGDTLTLPADALASALLVGQAERALREGRAAAASLLLQRAIDALPEGAPPCTVRATLLLARREIDVAAHAIDTSENMEAIEQACTEAQVEAAEQPVQRWMKAWIFARASRHTAASAADRPDEWSTPEGRRRWAEGARAAAGGVSGGRAALLHALVDEMTAISEEPTGPCDTETPARQLSAAKAAAQALLEAGRPDLALTMAARAVVRQDGTVDRAAVASLLARLDDPLVRWAREPLLSSAVSAASVGAFAAADPTAVAPLCRALFDELSQAVKTDRDEGFTDRNVSRVSSAFSSGLGCPNQKPLEALLDDVLARSIEGDDGGSGVLALLLGTGTHFMQNLLSGRIAELVASARTLVDGLGRLRDRLGDSAEHRALGPTLAALQASMALFVGGVEAPLDQLAEAAAKLDEVAAEPVAPDAPMMVKLAPGLHLGALALLAAGHAASGDTGAAQSVLVTLDQALPEDTRDLLRNLDAEDHAVEVVATVRAARAVIEAGFDGSLSSLEQARGLVEAAQVPGAAERGWWAVGLDAARMGLWDALAVLAFSVEQPAVAQAALEQAEGVVARLVDGALDQWQLRGTGWELLAVVPTLHRVAGRAIVEDREMGEAIQLVLAAVEAPMKDALGRLEASVEGATDPGLVELLVEVLVIGSDIGLSRIAAGGPELATLAERLAALASAERHPAELRVYLEAGAAAALWESDREQALAMMERAERTAAKSALQADDYLPGLVRTRLVADAGDLEQALAAVDDVLPAGKESLACGQFHAVHALLPFRAWLLAAMGRPGEWRAAWRQYADLVEHGFTGEGVVSCQLMSYRDNLIAGLNLSQLVRGMVLPVSQEGSFQVNLGMQAQERVHERLLCQAGPVAGRRPDIIMQAHLAAAVYAMLEGDDATAQAAMLKALDEGRLLLHGTPAALGAAAAGALSTARENAYLPLLAWTSVLARLRGHAHLGAQLHDVATAMADAQRTTLLDAVQAEEGLPHGLRRLARLEPLRPAVVAWLQASQASDMPALRTTVEKANKISKFGPPWAPAFAVGVHAVAIGPLAEAAKEALRQPLPKDPTGQAIVGGWQMLLRLVLDETVKSAELLAIITAYAEAGLPGEAGGFALKLGNIAYQNGNIAGAVALLEPAAQAIPRKVAPVLHADLLVRPTEAHLGRGAHEPAAAGLRVMWDELHGRIPPNEELQQRLALVNLLGVMERWDELDARISELLPIIGPAFGWQNTVVYRLRAVLVALSARDGALDEARLLPVLEWADQVQQAEDATTALRALRDAGGKPDEIRRIAREYLATVFVGG